MCKCRGEGGVRHCVFHMGWWSLLFRSLEWRTAHPSLLRDGASSSSFWGWNMSLECLDLPPRLKETSSKSASTSLLVGLGFAKNFSKPSTSQTIETLKGILLSLSLPHPHQRVLLRSSRGEAVPPRSLGLMLPSRQFQWNEDGDHTSRKRSPDSALAAVKERRMGCWFKGTYISAPYDLNWLGATRVSPRLFYSLVYNLETRGYTLKELKIWSQNSSN